MAVVTKSCLFLFFILAFSAGPVLAKPKKPAATARKEDIPFIKCSVCHQISEQLSRQTSKKREKIAPKQLSEYQIIEITENICNLKREEGDWLLHIDVVEDGDKLKLVDQEEEGECNTECKTIEKACQEVMGYHDTDVAEFLYKSAHETSAISKFLCDDLSEACSVKTPPVPKDRVPGEPFMPKSSKEAEMDRILRSMSDMPGAPSMKMYSKEDIMKMNMGNFGNEDDEDEDDEDEDILSRKTTGKSVQAGKIDWKKTLIDGSKSSVSTVKHQIQKALSKTKHHLDRVSNKLKKFYKEKTASTGNAGEL